MKLKIFSLILYLLASIPILQDGVFFNPIFTLLNLVIAAINIVSLFLYREVAYSLFKIYHIFTLFFFCIAPAIQFNNGIRFFGTYFSEEIYILTSIVVLLITLLYNFLYKSFYLSGNCNKFMERRGDEKLGLGKEVLLLGISASVCLYYLYVNDFNIFSLFLRGGELVDRVERSNSVSLITDNFLRPMPIIIFLIAYLSRLQHKLILPILFVFMIVAAPPTGMARFSAAAMYLPVLLLMFPMVQKRYNFINLIVLGLLVVFPMLDIFRNFALDEFSLSSFRLNFDQFTELHFDTYSMFMRVLKSDVITFGRQLLGVLFFFVPRSLWPNKPIGSGHYIGEMEHLEWTNLAMPFYGEGYINFGIIGVFLFVIIIAYVTAKIDKWYWVRGAQRKDVYSPILYVMLLGLMLLILRGDLMSSFAYTCGFTFSNVFLKKLMEH